MAYSIALDIAGSYFQCAKQHTRNLVQLLRLFAQILKQIKDIPIQAPALFPYTIAQSLATLLAARRLRISTNADYQNKTMKIQETEPTTYDPNRLLDAVLHKMQWKNDAALARELNVQSDVIRRIRSRTLPLGASMLLWMQDATGMEIDELRQLMGDRRSKLRISCSGNRFYRGTSVSHPYQLLALPLPLPREPQQGLEYSTNPVDRSQHEGGYFQKNRNPEPHFVSGGTAGQAATARSHQHRLAG